MAYDFKKEQKELYQPKTKPVIVDVPPMRFLMMDGQGNPNTSAAYQNSLNVLYGLSYTIKMTKDWPGWFEYVVPPLEGLWRVNDQLFTGPDSIPLNKADLIWTAMIRQPEFVTEAVLTGALDILRRKKPELDPTGVRLEEYHEGLCVQVLHIGSYDAEPETIRAMDRFAAESGYEIDMSGERRHHEIYLSDPRRTAQGKLKTVLRHPIRLK